MNPEAGIVPPYESPFHAGEQEIQSKASVRELAERMGRRMIRSSLPEQHCEFFASLPFVVIAGRDEELRPWASWLSGPPGFIASPTPEILEVGSTPSSVDPLSSAIRPGAALGLLGIEPATRRRNRVNGHVATVTVNSWTLNVDQSFGNCPQYITPRSIPFLQTKARRATEATGATPDPASSRASLAPELRGKARKLIEEADTFFIASGVTGQGARSLGMDVSHRGGPRAFVSVSSPTRLSFPDYPGNNAFNTLGNLALDPRAGLLFVDFLTGYMVQMSGRARVLWNASATGGASTERSVEFCVEAVIERHPHR